MCWNADISLNTFVFACIALVFIWIANTFTKYKSNMFENPLMYAFLFVVAAMQLIEYFLWKNLKNSARNNFLSKTAICLILAQHLLLMAMIPNNRSYFFLAYFLFLFLFYLFKFPTIVSYTTLEKNGHLSWEWMNFKGYEKWWIYVGLLFYMIPTLLLHHFIFTLFVTSLLIACLYYTKFNTFGTMWCWAINFIFLFVLVDILIIKPFREYNSLC